MAKQFRLLHVTGSFDRGDLFDHGGDARRAIDFEVADPLRCSQRDAWVSVVIGKNGVGKSRILAGISDLFEALFRESGRRRRDDHILSFIQYFCDDDVVEISASRSTIYSATVNGRKCSLDELPLPSKVIAFTTTPFDKFRISRSLQRTAGLEPMEGTERYSYLGLRDRTGRASTTAAIFRALEGLFDAAKSDAERRIRIAEVFGFLGYQPQVEVAYELSYAGRSRLLQMFDAASADEFFKRSGAPNPNFSQLHRLLQREPHLFDQILDVGKEMLSRSDGGRIVRLRADFDGSSDDDEFFRRLQILRRADLMRMSSVEVRRYSDGAVLDLRLASSGELGIVIGFLGLASVIEDGSLIFVDEPEISLHPEWQSKYIELLTETFRNFPGCHFVMATHSPLILSDIDPENSSVVRLGDPEVGESDEIAGKSYDYLLATAFRSPGNNNLYVKQEIIHALRMAADGNINTEEFISTVEELSEFANDIESDSPVSVVIRKLQQIRNMKGGIQ